MDQPEPENQQVPTANVVSGIVVGPVVQAGSISGGIHFHDSSESPTETPRQLIAPPPGFVGRDAELATLRRIQESGENPLVVLTGQGGVGKTALARRWAHEVRDRFADGHLYVDLNGFSEAEPVDPGEALGAFLRALGIPPQHIPPGLAEQAALYRTRTAGRSMLVILDNALSAAQVRVLLPGPGRSFVLVTSRKKLAGLNPEGGLLIDIPPLTVAESVALLETALGAARLGRDHTDAELVASLCAGLPIALSVVAARLAARPGLTLARLGSDLAVATNRLRGLDNAEGTSVQGSLDLSYSGLLPQVAMLYRRLAAHPGREFGLGPVAALISLIESDHDDASSAIDPLLRANLLEEPASDRFRYHDLLLLHAQQQLADRDTPADRERVLRTMLNWYWSAAAAADQVVTPYRRRLPCHLDPAPVGLPVFTEREEALDWLELERVNLMAAARAALDRGWGELAWRLSDVMWPLLLYHKHYRDRIEIDECGVAGARLWGNKWAEADMHKRAGRAYTTKGRYDEAERHLEAAIQLGREIGDRRGVVDAQEMNAALLRDSGRADAAIALFEEVLAVNRELGGARNIGMTLINLCTLLPAAGRGREALNLLQEAKEIFARLVGSDPYNGVRVDIALAAVYAGLGDLGRAQAAAVSGEEGMRRLGSSFEQAQAIELLGRIAHARGDVGAAEQHWAAALAVYETLVWPHAEGLRQKLAGLRRGTDPLPVQDLGEADE